MKINEYKIDISPGARGFVEPFEMHLSKLFRKKGFSRLFSLMFCFKWPIFYREMR
jgi:hypothetical protein